MSRYPKNWKEIAARLKESENWTCAKCNKKFEKGDRSLQVHHQDYTPENNDPSNLIALCAACHLEKHQGNRGNVTPGQLSLKLW